jgi:hypothetical protein
MKPEINITNELLSEFCDIHPNAVAIDRIDKAKVFPREVNTANFASLLSTSAEVLGGVAKVFSSILKAIGYQTLYLIQYSTSRKRYYTIPF